MWLRIAVGYNNINYEYDANGIRISKTEFLSRSKTEIGLAFGMGLRI